MQVPFEGEVELPLKGHLAFKGAAMVQHVSGNACLTAYAPNFLPCGCHMQALSIC